MRLKNSAVAQEQKNCRLYKPVFEQRGKPNKLSLLLDNQTAERSDNRVKVAEEKVAAK